MLLAANRTGGQVRTDFSVFPTPEFARVRLYDFTGETMILFRCEEINHPSWQSSWSISSYQMNSLRITCRPILFLK
jgi:hypothetical protein